MKWSSQLKYFFMIPAAPQEMNEAGFTKVRGDFSRVKTVYHTVSRGGKLCDTQFLLWHVPTLVFCLMTKESELQSGRRWEAGGNVTLHFWRVPLFGDLQPKLQSLKGNKDERRRTMTVWVRMLTECSSQWGELARLYFWPHHKRVGETSRMRKHGLPINPP